MKIRKLIFILLHPTRNEKTVPALTDLIYQCIDLIETCPEVLINITYHYITIKTKNTNVELWNANKYYAWLGNGWVNKKHFYNGMPSRSAQFEFKECLKKHGYNIHQPEPGTLINHFKLKC